MARKKKQKISNTEYIPKSIFMQNVMNFQTRLQSRGYSTAQYFERKNRAGYSENYPFYTMFVALNIHGTHLYSEVELAILEDAFLTCK